MYNNIIMYGTALHTRMLSPATAAQPQPCTIMLHAGWQWLKSGSKDNASHCQHKTDSNTIFIVILLRFFLIFSILHYTYI